MAIADKLTQIANNVPLVYDAGREKGKAEGGDSWYDTFWDSYQQNGNRESYQGAFSREGWNVITFKPKYNMSPANCAQMFQSCNITDLEKALQDAGVVLDTSNSTAFTQFIQSSEVAILPKIDLTKSANTSNAFSTNVIQKIEELVVRETTPFSKTFDNAFNLTHMIVTGTIGQNGFGVSSSTKLDKVSIESIINSLSTTTTGLSVTLSLTAVNKAFETSAGANDGSTSAEWLSLIATKTDTTQQYYWVISLL